jgi:N-acetylglucosamine-6-phosphate deacetylase
VTMSPEYAEAPAFIARATASGVVVAIGHTSAGNEQIEAAAAAGARLSTHLGNGSHPQLHRLRNYLWKQLADDRLSASLIADGHHLPPEVLRVFVRAKSPGRCILISDLSGQAGQPPGRYTSPFCDVELLDDGRLVVAGQRELLAGAAAPLGQGIPQVIHDAGVDLAQAVDMATLQPARLLREPAGALAPGNRADLVQFRLGVAGDRPVRQFVVVATIAGGRPVYGLPWPQEVPSRP